MSTDQTVPFGTSSNSPEFDPELLRAGQKLAGVFKLVKALPSAMGETAVWIAQDEVAEREVSLFFVPGSIGTDPDVCDALRAEVRRARQLIHPNILRVHDLADEPAWSAVVMDSFDGQSLARLLQEKDRGFFEASEISGWVDSLLKILGDAHGIGLLHRNLRLSDILVGEDGKVTISNFGISRVILDALRRKGTAEDSQLVYSSPKQLAGDLPTAADDIYSVGACLYELLTGQPVFEGRGIEDKIRSSRPLLVTEGRQSAGKKGDLLYANWEKVISQCLSKDPSERPESILKLQERLGLLNLSGALKLETPPAAVGGVSPEKGGVKASSATAERAQMNLDDLDELPDGDASEHASFGAPRPLFTSPRSEVERSRQSRNALIFWLIAAGGIGAGIWFGSSALIKKLSSKPPEPLPESQPVLEVEKSPDAKFVPPSVPGTEPELLALRPGEPAKSRTSVSPGGLSPQGIDPVPLDPPAPAPAPRVEPPAPAPVGGGDGRLKVAPMQEIKQEEVKEENAKTKSPLEEAQMRLESAIAEAVKASKEYDRLKAKKDPNTAQKVAIADAKKAKAAADYKVAQAQKELDQLSQSLQPSLEPSTPKPVEPTVKPQSGELNPTAPQLPIPAPEPREEPKPETKPAGSEVKKPKAAEGSKTAPAEVSVSKTTEGAKTLGAGPNSIGMEFAPVGDVMFSVYETRVKDFITFAGESGFSKPTWKSPGFEQSLDHPVVRVSWNDANLFCKWLTERERKLGLLAAGEYYRLPTDVEWSKAAGLPEEGGDSPQARDHLFADRFPWGIQWPPPVGSGNFRGQETGSDIAIKGYTDAFPWTSPAGSFKPNEYGLYDMSGNVWEWCMDTFNKQAKVRVLRGGAFDVSLKDGLISSCRISAQPERERDSWGFRVVRSKDGGKGGQKTP